MYLANAPARRLWASFECSNGSLTLYAIHEVALPLSSCMTTSSTLKTMTSVEIRTLSQPPNTYESDARVLAYLNSNYKSLDDLEQDAGLGKLVEHARQELEALDAKVRSFSIPPY